MDAIKVLDFYNDLVQEQPLTNKRPIQIGGDQLTSERYFYESKARKPANFSPTTFEFFHLGIFLKKLYLDHFGVQRKSNLVPCMEKKSKYPEILLKQT